jgi:integrase
MPFLGRTERPRRRFDHWGNDLSRSMLQSLSKPVGQLKSHLKAGGKFPQRWSRRIRPKRLTSEEIDRKLIDQDHRCIYCGCRFGATLKTPWKYIQTWRECDHFIPYGVLGSSSRENIILACNFCNRQKRNKLFASISDVRAFIADIWRRHKISIV